MKASIARRSALRLLAFIAVAAGTGCGATQGGALPSPASARGSLVIVGGGPRPPELRERFVQLAGGAGKANVVVFAMASLAGRESGEEEAAALRTMGVDAVNLYVTRDEAATDSIVNRVARATGIWFGGGDQSRLTAALKGTRTEAMMHERFRAGAVIGGTSAGAAVMSQIMLTGEERRRGGSRYPSDSGDVNLTIERGNVVTGEGFGFLTNAIVDQHFVRRKRHNRLITLVLENPSQIGVGVDESTALVVTPDGKWSVIGASVAVIYDARQARVTAPGARTLGGAGLKMHVLPGGATYDPKRGEAALPSTSKQ